MAPVGLIAGLETIADFAGLENNKYAAPLSTPSRMGYGFTQVASAPRQGVERRRLLRSPARRGPAPFIAWDQLKGLPLRTAPFHRAAGGVVHDFGGIDVQKHGARFDSAACRQSIFVPDCRI